MTDKVRFIEAQTGFRVANLDRSLEFYAQLGFEQVYRNEDGKVEHVHGLTAFLSD
jgi:catechol 2,3-dioxygenase-like lactoylglutathione lyase family enzyme